MLTPRLICQTDIWKTLMAPVGRFLVSALGGPKVDATVYFPEQI